MIKVSASLLAANKEDIINETIRLKNNGVDCVHFDVMDNPGNLHKCQREF